jgi:endonuclease-3 related protein
MKPGRSNIKPLAVYHILLKTFGHQGWWPVTKPGQHAPEYRPRSYRRNERERFEICVGAVLTQNTAWVNVEKALANLNRTGMLDPWRLARLPAARIATLIRPSGYYNQKAGRLKKLAAFFVREYGANLVSFFARPTATVRAELLSLDGVGPETADSILLYAGNKLIFVVDAYTRRLGRRLGWFATNDYDAVKAFFESVIPVSERVCNEFHALIVRLGKEYCRSKPQCRGCPLGRRCPSSLS